LGFYCDQERPVGVPESVPPNTSEPHLDCQLAALIMNRDAESISTVLLLQHARYTCEVCASVEALDELAQVLDRKKFDRYLDKESRRAFVEIMRHHLHLFAVQQADLAAVDPPCRDHGTTNSSHWRSHPKPMPWSAAMMTCWYSIPGAGFRS
jgi:hypothetical protein